jgi:hypothetical protein
MVGEGPAIKHTIQAETSMKHSSASIRVVLTIFLVGAAACAPAPRQRPVELGPVDQGAGSLTEARKYLEGRWTLESFEIYPPGKSPIALKGSGVLVYDAFGNLKMEIRADQASSDLLRSAGVEIRDGVISTEGRTVVDLQHKTLTYVIEGQPAGGSGPLATSRPRHWQVDGNVLTLTTKDDAGNPLSVGRWRKTP